MNRWYYWCWAFGELTRQMPAILQVDDHDVYQGNLWGWGGRRNTSRNDKLGGYLQEADFVNMVQRVQCGHDPDPYDPTPVEQGITVYYTGFEYGGVGFAVIEDRKFKTPPGYEGERPTLLGDRQQRFLAEWAADWNDQDLKVCVTQTNFGAVQTYWNGNLVSNRDSNAAPVEGRRRALKSLRAAGAVVVAGDTHLATLVRAGIDTPTDGVYMFTVPPVANKHRRWFDPKLPAKNHPKGAPNFVGDFVDSFGNPMRVLAVANPPVAEAEVRSWTVAQGHPYRQTVIGREFVSDGFGIVRLNRRKRTVRFECWPWNADIADGDAAQFDGWPVTIEVETPLTQGLPVEKTPSPK
jgi:alkaline phosphatase D